MASGRTTPRDALLDRADRAIADALETCAQVRANVAKAWRTPPRRPIAGGGWLEAPRASAPVPDGRGDLPWSVAHALATARVTLQAADAELERPWRRALLPAPEAPGPPRG